MLLNAKEKVKLTFQKMLIMGESLQNNPTLI